MVHGLSEPLCLLWRIQWWPRELPPYGGSQLSIAVRSEGALMQRQAKVDVRKPATMADDAHEVLPFGCLLMGVREMYQLEAAVDREPAVVPKLMAVLRRFGGDHRVEREGSELAR